LQPAADPRVACSYNSLPEFIESPAVPLSPLQAARISALTRIKRDIADFLGHIKLLLPTVFSPNSRQLFRLSLQQRLLICNLVIALRQDTCGGNEKFRISWRFDYNPNAPAIINY
jgi:hypothetical protein